MIKTFFEDLPQIPSGQEPTSIQFDAIASSMVLLAKSLDLNKNAFPEAVDGQELVYPLHVAENAPSLYLVSDAAGVASAPHEHPTWAVIAGISGNEVNRIFVVGEVGMKKVRPVSKREIGYSGVLCMRSDEIHATYAAGNQATYHLHLYGKPLHLFPPYQTRCYTEN
jgi:predicted metal-dependent enzyme (double-stranded beta helix superfamily)